MALLSLSALLLLGAFVVTIAAALGRAPLWVAVLLVVLVQMLGLGWAIR